MVGNLTIGKKKYAAVEAEMCAGLDRLAALRERLLGLIEEDALAFAPLAATYGMPKDTPVEQELREAAMQKALIGAIEVPLEIMRQCRCVIEQTDLMASKGSRLALSDAGVAAVFAKAALLGASLNIFINTASLTDASLADQYNSEANDIIREGSEMADRVFDSVMSQIR
jgi:formiminotetrahydrofolate cyclodeaminase